MSDPTFTYAQAETILARLHDANSHQQAGAFRARLKHLKKLGVPLGSHPGRGKKIDYSKEHLYQWAFCLECAQFGFDPTWTAEWLKKSWSGIYEVFWRAERNLRRRADQDLFMLIEPRMMTYAWSTGAGRKILTPFFKVVPEHDLSKHLNYNKMGAHFRRKCLLNVSAIVRLIDGIQEENG
jgi:hypothetical protein